MEDKVYLVMREKGIHTDGHTYYEAETAVMGIRHTIEDAVVLLGKVLKKYHPEDKPSSGIYNPDNGLETGYFYKLEEGLSDNFWVKPMKIGESGDQY